MGSLVAQVVSTVRRLLRSHFVFGVVVGYSVGVALRVVVALVVAYA